jgi:hypothetical protein
MAKFQEDTTCTDNNVLHIRTPMTIAANASVEVICNKPIEVELLSESYVLVTASSPTTVTAGPQPMRILPSGEWGEVFARGWRSLPLELNFEVLRYIFA